MRFFLDSGEYAPTYFTLNNDTKNEHEAANGVNQSNSYPSRFSKPSFMNLGVDTSIAGISLTALALAAAGSADRLVSCLLELEALEAFPDFDAELLLDGFWAFGGGGFALGSLFTGVGFFGLGGCTEGMESSKANF